MIVSPSTKEKKTLDLNLEKKKKKKRNRKKNHTTKKKDPHRAQKKLHGSKELGTVTVDMCIGGMRGITVCSFSLRWR